MPIARSRSFVIEALSFACDRSPHRRAARALALVIVLGLHAGEATSDVARRRAYPSASTILVEPDASPYRAHVARMGEASLSAAGGDAIEGALHALGGALELIVVDERADRVRVLYPFDHDGARVMVWLDARDLAWSIAAPVRIAGRGDAGIWLLTGAPVTVGRAGRATRRVTYRELDDEVTGDDDDDALVLRGTVPREALTRIFPVPARPEHDDGDGLWHGEDHLEATRLRVAPGGGALHRGRLFVDVVERRGAWTEVEYRSRYVRMRGWVGPQDVPHDGYNVCGCTRGSGFDGGYGASHAERIAIPPGACLYDRAGGELVGLERRGQDRFSFHHDGDWWEITVSTPWGLARVWAHSLGDMDGAPAWERCDRAAP